MFTGNDHEARCFANLFMDFSFEILLDCLKIYVGHKLFNGREKTRKKRPHINEGN